MSDLQVRREPHPAGGTLHRVASVPVRQALRLLDAPASVEVHRNRRGRVERVEDEGEVFARKIADYGSLTTRVRNSLGDSDAHRAWRTALSARDRELPVPAPVLLHERRTWGLVDRSVLVTRWVEGSHLHHCVLRTLPPSASPGRRRAFCRDLSSFLLRLREGGLATRDLAPHNVQAREVEPDRWSFVLVDLDDARLTDGPLPADAVVRYLVQLGHLPPAISRTDRLRFLRVFLEEGGAEALAGPLREMGRRDLVRHLADEIARKARAKRARLRSRTGDPTREDVLAGWGLDPEGRPPGE